MRRTGRMPEPGKAPGPVPDLKGLAKGVAAAASAFEAQRAAFKDEKRAEEELLRRVVDAVHPALPAIMTRLPTGGLRGALVATKNGAALYLREDAVFVETSGQLRPLRTFPNLAAVLLDWDPEPIIRNLAMLVDAQVTGRGPSTLEAERRAAKLHALAKLLEED